MSADEVILSAFVGYVCEDYNGNRSEVVHSLWRAKLAAWILGPGWFVKELREPVLIISRPASDR